MRFSLFFFAFLGLLMLTSGKANERKQAKKGRSGDQAPKANGQGSAQTPVGNGWGSMGSGQPFMGAWQFSGFPNAGRPNGGANPSGFSGFWG